MFADSWSFPFRKNAEECVSVCRGLLASSRASSSSAVSSPRHPPPVFCSQYMAAAESRDVALPWAVAVVTASDEGMGGPGRRYHVLRIKIGAARLSGQQQRQHRAQCGRPSSVRWRVRGKLAPWRGPLELSPFWKETFVCGSTWPWPKLDVI